MFVLAQSGKPEARQVLVDIAKSNPNPDVQKHAIRNLGLFGGPESQQTLVDIYSTSQSIEARKAVLQALMLSGDKSKVYEVATKETHAGAAARGHPAARRDRAAAKSCGRSTRRRRIRRCGVP